MDKSEVRKSSELLKLENPDASSEAHLAKLLSLRAPKLNAFDCNQLKTHRVHSSLVLDRVKDFLPNLKEANDELEAAIKDRGRKEFDIENVEHVNDVIEMNLAVVERDEDNSDGCSSSDDENEIDNVESKKVVIDTLSSSVDQSTGDRD